MIAFSFIHNNMQLLYEKIEKLRCEVLVPANTWGEVQQTKQSMDQKEIMINVFGEHNCGKSTFINALLRN